MTVLYHENEEGDKESLTFLDQPIPQANEGKESNDFDNRREIWKFVCHRMRKQGVGEDGTNKCVDARGDLR